MAVVTSVPAAGEVPAVPAPRRREPYLDGLRALAALHVMFHHIYLEVYPVEYGVLPRGITRVVSREMAVSGAGVALFIVLSGYSLALGARRDGWTLRGGTWAFFRRRARRLLPPYWVALALSLVLSATVLSAKTGTHWDASVPFSATDVVSHVLLLHDVIGSGTTINHALWSIALTWQAYLFFPLLLWGIRRYGMRRAVTVVVSVTALIGIVAGAQHSPVLLLRSFQLIGAFAVGTAALEITRRGGVVRWRGRMVRPPWTAMSFGLLVLWAVASLNHVPFILSMGCLLVALGTGSAARLGTLLQWRPLVWLGLISYSLWLVHAPLVHLVWLKLLHPLGLDVGEPATLFALLAVSVPLSIVAAWGFYHAVEKRSLSRPSLLRRRQELEAALEVS